MQSCRLPRLGEWPANLPLRFALGLIFPRFLPRLVLGPETSGKVLGTTDVPFFAFAPTVYSPGRRVLRRGVVACWPWS